MLSRFLRTVLFPVTALSIFLAIPVTDAFAAVCCHCYFTQQARGQQTQCIQIPTLDTCDSAAIMRLQSAGGSDELLRAQSTRQDLVFRCDASPVSSALCHAGTGATGDRCPSRPPITLSGAALLAAYPTPPAPGAADAPATNATNSTNAAGNATTDPTNNTNSSGGNSTRQATARNYSTNFPNPLPGLTIQKTIGGIVRIVVGLVGILFLLVFVWGSFLYMTAAGDPKQTQQGKDAIKNAVIGLAIVMISYTAVSLVISTAGTLMGTTTAPVLSQDAPDTESAPTNRPAGNGDAPATDPAQPLCGCTCGDGTMSFEPVTGICSNSSCHITCDRICTGAHGGVRDSSCSGAGSEGGSAPTVCANYYAGPVENCFRTGGACPAGANSLSDLLTIWGSRLPGGNSPTSQNACRACIEHGVEILSIRFPLLDTTCIPADVQVWNGECRSACIGSGGSGVTDGSMLCSSASYADEPGCRSCLAHAMEVMTSRATSPEGVTILGAGCPTQQGKALIWCSTGHPGWDAAGSICDFR